MARHVDLRELLVGVEGLALLRHLYDSSDAAAGRRLEEVRRVLDDDALAGGEPIDELEPRAGYGAWSVAYDEPGNPIIALEQPAVWSLLHRAEHERALDAACGTGRHARRLVDLGYDVVGIDAAPEMLQRAVASVPEARFVEADLRAIPLPDGEVDVVVCGLALAHLTELGTAVTELVRVLRPGGQLVISVLHPFLAQLGWHAPFEGPDGRRAFVREHAHLYVDYLTAFRAAQLHVSDCLEPLLTAEEASAKRRAYRHIPRATLAAYVGLPGVLVWSASKPLF
jgi:ubiquinone/menaquinone biosynthesis C-methylase UbiE